MHRPQIDCIGQRWQNDRRSCAEEAERHEGLLFGQPHDRLDLPDVESAELFFEEVAAAKDAKGAV